jgi:hypothetical protein
MSSGRGAAVAGIDFFETAFGTADDDQAGLHAQAVASLLEEAHGWRDLPTSGLGQEQRGAAPRASSS